jgi:type IV secretory pathway VirB10-like protein
MPILFLSRDSKILISATYEDNISLEKLNMDRITIYVEHPEPLEPPAEPAPPPPQPLKLTKKEQKKLRTQRRLAKEKDRQEMIRQGLLEPPKPKVKMSNLMYWAQRLHRIQRVWRWKYEQLLQSVSRLMWTATLPANSHHQSAV